MNTPELLLTAVALAMDAFAVSIASGCTLKCVSKRQAFRMSFHFGLFQALMPIIGWYLGVAVHGFVESYAPWIAFGLLCYIGVNMIREAFGDDEEDACKCDPTTGMTLVMLSVATSIDALAVGLSLAMLGVSVWWPALVIGLVASAFTLVGLYLGETAAKAKRLGHFAEVLGGLVLLGIGVNILREHGMLPFLTN